MTEMRWPPALPPASRHSGGRLELNYFLRTTLAIIVHADSPGDTLGCWLSGLAITAPLSSVNLDEITNGCALISSLFSLQVIDLRKCLTS
jgi:hypothetical protein